MQALVGLRDRRVPRVQAAAVRLELLRARDLDAIWAMDAPSLAKAQGARLWVYRCSPCQAPLLRRAFVFLTWLQLHDMPQIAGVSDLLTTNVR